MNKCINNWQVTHVRSVGGVCIMVGISYFAAILRADQPCEFLDEDNTP